MAQSPDLTLVKILMQRRFGRTAWLSGPLGDNFETIDDLAHSIRSSTGWDRFLERIWNCNTRNKGGIPFDAKWFSTCI
jgi:hypothetical protein